MKKLIILCLLAIPSFCLQGNIFQKMSAHYVGHKKEFSIKASGFHISASHAILSRNPELGRWSRIARVWYPLIIQTINFKYLLNQQPAWFTNQDTSPGKLVFILCCLPQKKPEQKSLLLNF